MSGPSPAEIAAADNAQCVAYGFKFGTDAYANCRMNIEQSRAANRMALAAAFINNSRAPAPAPYIIPPRRPVNCTSMPMGNMVSTNCY